MDTHIKVFDTTLRDGEQSPGCSMNLREKLDIAHHLEALNVDVIEAGFAISSQGDFEAIAAISKQLKKTRICSLARAVQSDIKQAAASIEAAKYPRIHTFIATSDIHMMHKLKMSRDEVLTRAVEAVRYAKEFVEDVEFSCEDAGRSDRAFLAQVYSAVIAAGATVINVPDTVGYMEPSEFGALISYLKAHVEGSDRVDISVHCHNDLGLATANALAGVANGATQIECTVNGIGERAGNTALEEVVMAMYVRQDQFAKQTQINMKDISKISRLVSLVTGSVVQPNKAIVGANAFAHEAGIHQDGVLKFKTTYEIMSPELIGAAQKPLVLGKHSGRHAFMERMKALGYTLNHTDLEKSFVRFKALADKKKEVLEDDLHALVADEVYQEEERIRLVCFNVESNTQSMPVAAVGLMVEGKTIHKENEGAGSVDALYKTIDAIVGEAITLKEYTLQSISGGTDALGEVVVRVADGDRVFAGRSSSTDILLASVKAYLHAINKVLLARNSVRIKASL